MKLREFSDAQAAALEAALSPPAEAVAAWARLRELTGDLDVIDRATFRALPMVYRNLASAGLPADELGKLRGVYRQAWVRNRIVMRAGLDSVVALREAGIQPVVLKGLGLIATVYPEPALRPMDDVDLLLPPGTYSQAANCLMARGWRPTRGDVRRFWRRSEVFHGMPLVGPAGVEVDLHRAMLEENIGHGMDGPLRERAITAEVDGVPLLTLSREDHVINACVHGARWDWLPSLRWVLDLSAVLRSDDAFDWDYVVAEARRREVSLSLGAALKAASKFEPLVPASVVAELAAIKTGRLERWSFASQQAADNLLTLSSRSILRYLSMANRRSFRRKVMDFPVYLEWVWELESPRAIPGDLLRRVWKRLRGQSGGEPSPPVLATAGRTSE